MATKQRRTSSKTVAKKQTQTAGGLRSSYKLGKKKFSVTLFAFIMLGVLVGGYFLIKSRAESNCVNNDAAVCAGWQATPAGADKAVDGYNAEITVQQLTPNFAITDDTLGIPCIKLYPRDSVSTYTNVLNQKFGKSNIMLVNVNTYHVFTRTLPQGTGGTYDDTQVLDALEPKFGLSTCALRYDGNGLPVVISVKNTGTKPWNDLTDVVKLGVWDGTGKEIEKWFGGLTTTVLEDAGSLNVTSSAYRGTTDKLVDNGLEGVLSPLKDTSRGVACGSANRDGTTNCVVNPGETVSIFFKVKDISTFSLNKWTDCPSALNNNNPATTSKCVGISKAGHYQIPLQMVVDGKYWFGNKTVVDFYAVDDLAPVATTKAFYENLGYTYLGPLYASDRPFSLCYKGKNPGVNTTPNTCANVPDGQIACTTTLRTNCYKVPNPSATPTTRIKPTPNQPYDSK